MERAEFDLGKDARATALSSTATRVVLLGVGSVFAVGGALLVAGTPPPGLRQIAPLVAFTWVVAASCGVVGARSTGAGPDHVVIDDSGIELRSEGKLRRKLAWSDPAFSLVLSDFSTDPRANSLPRLPLFQMQLARGKAFWAITPECYAAIVAAAGSHGMKVVRTSAARYHFPEGEIVTIGAARSGNRSTA